MTPFSLFLDMNTSAHLLFAPASRLRSVPLAARNSSFAFPVEPHRPSAMVFKKQRLRGANVDNGEPHLSCNFGVSGLIVSDHSVTVPLDYTGELPGTIDVFFRIVVHRNKQEDRTLPYLLYLQGGPGFEAPRPLESSGWIKAAVNYFRVVLMDQRGTGLSAGITCANLEARGPPAAQARYLRCFRADSIVRDAEAIRSTLALESTTNQSKASDDTRWSILGQSFGGFVCVTYLSLAPAALLEVLITGGLPPGITSRCSADDVYRKTYTRVLKQNSKFYSRFPLAEERARNVVLHLAAQSQGYVTTPAGNTLSPRSFQLLGLQTLGFSQGFERLHYLLECAFDGTTGQLSPKFLKEFDTMMAWDTNPLYALLHEAIYCQGGASRWAAHRIREAEYSEAFDALGAARSGRQVMFTGEMVFPWMFDEFKELRRVKEAADIVANDEAWPALYSAERLQRNVVPTASATYFEDMFVDFSLAQDTADLVRGLQQHVTSEWLHDGLRENGGVLFEKLLNMVRGGIVPR